MSAASPAKSVEEQIVDTQRALAGPHPGFRPVHAKGLMCAGTFRASVDARDLTRAVHLHGEPVLAVIRFSNGNGDPQIHDGLPSNRALAVKFSLPDGEHADIVANSIDGFPARTPEEFLAFLQTQLPDPATGKPSPDKVPRFLESHPAAKAFIERLMKKPVPASYAQVSYHAIHAFRFTNEAGVSRFGRYHWTPSAGEAFLTPEDGAKRTPEFLREELAARLARGPVVFRLDLQLAAPADPTDDPTALWPADRPVVALGRLDITAISPTGPADERRHVFDPGNLTDGIERSADPILLARSPAYSISFDRRSRGI
jgi:catalase